MLFKQCCNATGGGVHRSGHLLWLLCPTARRRYWRRCVSRGVSSMRTINHHFVRRCFVIRLSAVLLGEWSKEVQRRQAGRQARLVASLLRRCWHARFVHKDRRHEASWVLLQTFHEEEERNIRHCSVSEHAVEFKSHRLGRVPGLTDGVQGARRLPNHNVESS